MQHRAWFIASVSTPIWTAEEWDDACDAGDLSPVWSGGVVSSAAKSEHRSNTVARDAGGQRDGAIRRVTVKMPAWVSPDVPALVIKAASETAKRNHLAYLERMRFGGSQADINGFLAGFNED